MDPSNKDHNRKRRIPPFDIFDDNDFNKVFDEMIRTLTSTRFKEMIKKILEDEIKGNNRIIIKPYLEMVIIRESNISPEKLQLQKPYSHPPNNPLNKRISSGGPVSTPDVIKGKEDVTVTLDMPDVEKKNINLNISEYEILLSIDNPNGEYLEHIILPCSVKPITAKTTYKNGVLDIVLKRKREAL